MAGANAPLIEKCVSYRKELCGFVFRMTRDPAVGFSVWEARAREEFDGVFAAWGRYYRDAEISEDIGANESMARLMKG
jgi:hypothetical protein